MSDSENLDYLQEGFNPWGLTVPRLRSILVTHNVQYPGTAKKGQLVELFNEHLVPRAGDILAVRARATRTSRGIVDADTQSTASSDMFGEEPVAPRRSRASSPRKTTRVKRESEDPEHMPPPTVRTSPRKRQSRSASVQAPAASDTDTGPDLESPMSTKRSTSRKLAQAPVKLEPPEEHEVITPRFPRHMMAHEDDDNVFSNDNPFQSGGNTPQTVTKTPSHRRKTTGFESTQTKTPSDAARRRTDGPAFGATYNYNDFAVPSVETPLTSLSKASDPKTPQSFPEEVVEAGEEFTPDEQLALEQEVQANPELAITRQKSEQSVQRRGLSTPIWALISTLLVAYAAWYRQEKVAVGYCGLGREPTLNVPSRVELRDWPEWLPDSVAEYTSKIAFPEISFDVPNSLLVLLQPNCEPCPLHAYCSEDFVARCEHDYLLKLHPLSLNGLIPLPPTCAPDGEKARRVKIVADRAVDELRERHAKYECGEPIDEEGHILDSPAIEVEDLKETVSKKRSKRMDEREFDELWIAAIGEVQARDEVEVQTEEVRDPTGSTGGISTTRLSSASLARLSYACSVRRSVKLGLARYQLSIAGVMASLIMFLYGRYRFQSYRALSAQVPALVDTVLERLSNQKELAFEDGADDAFLFLPNMRDDILRHIHSLKERDRIWARVRAVVEQNSNVRSGQRESRNGEVGRAWEWIGPARARIDDGADIARRQRQSARVSWGTDVKPEDNVAVSRPPAPELKEDRAAAHKKWEESRPIY